MFIHRILRMGLALLILLGTYGEGYSTTAIKRDFITLRLGMSWDEFKQEGWTNKDDGIPAGPIKVPVTAYYGDGHVYRKFDFEKPDSLTLRNMALENKYPELKNISEVQCAFFDGTLFVIKILWTARKTVSLKTLTQKVIETYGKPYSSELDTNMWRDGKTTLIINKGTTFNKHSHEVDVNIATYIDDEIYKLYKNAEKAKAPNL